MSTAIPWLILALTALPLSAQETAADCTVPASVAATRPDPEDVPTEVAVGLYVIDVTEIDDVRQTFTADLHLAVSWHDPRLGEASLGRSLAACRLGLSEIWHPHIDVLNQRNLDEHYDDVVAIDGEGHVLYRQRFFGTLSSRVDLRDFPFDRQILEVNVASFRFDSGEVELTVDERRTGRLEPFSLTGWSVELGGTRVTSEEIAPQNRSVALLHYELVGERQSLFFVLKVILPLSLIVFMAWTVFWIDPSLLPPRVGISTASVLTLIAFQWSLGHLLPRVSYLTRVDRFTLGASLLVFLALGEAILTARLARTEREPLGNRIDRWSRVVYPVVLVVILFVAFGK